MKKGDLVVCVDNMVCDDVLTLGKVYKVLEVRESENGDYSDVICVEDDFFRMRYYYKYRFKLLSEVRKEKLLKLSECRL